MQFAHIRTKRRAFTLQNDTPPLERIQCTAARLFMLRPAYFVASPRRARSFLQSVDGREGV